MENLDDYNFKKDGSSEKIETNDKFDRVISDRNEELEELEKSDKYDFAKKEGDKLIYEVPKNTIKDYKQMETLPGADKEGTIFTVTDKEHADKIFRMLAGNSLVEYGKADYANGKVEESQVWTGAHPTKSGVEPIVDIVSSKYDLKEKMHSHPFKGGDLNVVSMGFPSNQDVTNVEAYKNNPSTKNTKHKVYSPYNPSPETQPFDVLYDNKGVKGILNKVRDNYEENVFKPALKSDYNKNISEKDRERYKNYYLWQKKG